MALTKVQNPATYKPAAGLAIIYATETGYAYNTNGTTGATITAKELKVLGVDAAKLPAIVFEEDVVDALGTTLVDVSGVTVARSSKASVNYVKQIADQKVDKEVFLSAIVDVDDKATAAIAANAEAIAANAEAIEKLGQLEDGDTITEALAKKLDKDTYDQDMITVNAAIDGKVAKVEGSSLVADTEISKLSAYPQYSEVSSAIDGKVAKVEGSSLVADSEIGKLAAYPEYSTISGAIADVANKANASDVYTKTAADEMVAGKISEAISSVFKFKGTVEDMAGLAAVQSPAEGDVYHVTTGANGTSAEYVYVEGKGWQELGTVISLAAYATTEYVDGQIDGVEGQIAGEKTAREELAGVVAGKVDQSVYNEKVAAIEEELGKKVAQTAYDEQVAALTTSIGANADAIGVINGTDATAGSIAYAVKAEQDRATGVEAQLRTDVDAKLATATFTAFQETNSQAITDAADAAKQAAIADAEGKINAYKTSNDAAVQKNAQDITALGTNKVNVTDFDAYKGTVSAEFAEVEANATTGVMVQTDTNVEAGKFYIVNSAVTCTLPAEAAVGTFVKIAVLTGGAERLVVAQEGETILGSSNPCALGITEEGLAIDTQTYIFVKESASNWNVL